MADCLKPENTGYKIYIGIAAGSLTHLSSGLFIHLLIVVFLSLSAQAATVKYHRFPPSLLKGAWVILAWKSLPPPFKIKEKYP